MGGWAEKLEFFSVFISINMHYLLLFDNKGGFTFFPFVIGSTLRIVMYKKKYEMKIIFDEKIKCFLFHYIKYCDSISIQWLYL